MSAPPAPPRRLHEPLRKALGAGMALLMALTGAVALTPASSAAASSATLASLYPPGIDTSTYASGVGPMAYPRSPYANQISRDLDRDRSPPQMRQTLKRKPPPQRHTSKPQPPRAAAGAQVRIHHLAASRWVLPLEHYSLSARFGEISWLWSSSHTGLDFVAAAGTPIKSIAGGKVTQEIYDGAYGYKTVVTLDDGTEIWYCHQMSFAVAAGAEVDPGDLIGYVGYTGNVTGSHLHLEVRPEGGDPIDPFATLVQHGLSP